MTSAALLWQNSPHGEAMRLLAMSFIWRSLMQPGSNPDEMRKGARRRLSCLSLNGESEAERATRERVRLYWEEQRLVTENFYRAMNDNTWLGMTRDQLRQVLDDYARQQRLASAAQKTSKKRKKIKFKLVLKGGRFVLEEVEDSGEISCQEQDNPVDQPLHGTTGFVL